MTNPDGKAYTLRELQDQQERTAQASAEADSRRFAQGGPIDPADPWGHRGRVPTAIDELREQLAKLEVLVHTLFDGIAPILADPGDKPSDETNGNVGPKPADYDHTSPLHQQIVQLGHKVRDLQQDVTYVTRRIEL